MKRIALTIVLAVLASCTAMQAQYYVRYSTNTGCENHIIRSCPEYTFLTEVLYSKDNVSGYMELWVEGVSACRIPVSLSYEVKDIFDERYPSFGQLGIRPHEPDLCCAFCSIEQKRLAVQEPAYI